jgi:hypothetical protein
MTSFVLILGILGIYRNETILALKPHLRLQARKVLETEIALHATPTQEYTQHTYTFPKACYPAHFEPCGYIHPLGSFLPV